MSKKDSRQEYLEKRRQQYRESKKRQRARNAGSIFEFSVRLTREDMETLNNIIEHSELNRTTAVSALIRQAQQRKQAYDISFKETDLVTGSSRQSPQLPVVQPA